MKNKKQTIQQWQQEWYELNAPTGRALGYPECCIKAFGNQPPKLLEISGPPTKQDIKRYQAGCINGQFTGFIPCGDHANKILSGQLALKDLIKNRNPELPVFPNF